MSCSPLHCSGWMLSSLASSSLHAPGRKPPPGSLHCRKKERVFLSFGYGVTLAEIKGAHLRKSSFSQPFLSSRLAHLPLFQPSLSLHRLFNDPFSRRWVHTTFCSFFCLSCFLHLQQYVIDLQRDCLPACARMHAKEALKWARELEFEQKCST